jgi:hypothetical protein
VLSVFTHDQTKLSSTDSVDHEQGWDGEDDLHRTVAQRCKESLLVGVVDSGEDGGTVE